MPQVDQANYILGLESRLATLETLMGTLERTVVEQSESLELSHRAEAHLAAIVRSADTAIVSLSMDFRVLSWNPAAERLFGYTEQEAGGRTPTELFAFASDAKYAHDLFELDLEQFGQTLKSHVFEQTLHRKDNSTFEASMTASGIYDSGARLTGVSLMVRDISAASAKEREFARLAAIVDSSENAITSISTDGRLTSLNPSAEKLFGFSEKEAVGQPLEITVPEQYREITKRRLTEDLEALGTTTGSGRRQFEISLPGSDGTIAEMILVVGPIYDRAGKLLGMYQSYQDVTALRRTERENALMAAIVRASQDAIISTSLDNRILSWNPGAEAFFGVPAAEAIGKEILAFVPPEDHPVVGKAVAEVVQSGKPGQILIRSRRADETTVESLVNLFPTFDQAGNVVSVGAIGRDVTEILRLERRTALLAAIVESSGDAIISIAPDLTILSWNRSAELLYGYSATEAVGQQLMILVPSDTHDRVRAMTAELLANPGRILTFEAPTLRKNGSQFRASITAFSVYDKAGKLLSLSAIVGDITAAKEREKEQALLSAIVTSTDDAVISLSLDGRISSWNHSAELLLGFSANEAVGNPISLYLPPALRQFGEAGVVSQLAAASEHRLVEHLETQVQNKNGSLLDASIVVSGIYDSDGHLTGLSGIMRDITERKTIERRLAIMASIVDAYQDPIIALDRDLKIVIWAPGSERTFGIGRDAVLGRGLETFVPTGHLEQELELCRRVLRTGLDESLETSFFRPDGSAAAFLVSLFPLRDASSAIVGIGEIGRDISTLKQTEESLRAAHEYTRGLIESSIDAMIMIDGELRITDCNEQFAKLTQVPKKILTGSALDTYFSDPKAARDALQKTLGEGMVANVLIPLKSASGEEIAVSFNGSLFYRAGKVLGIFVVARDVTEQQAVERTLREEREYGRTLVQSSPDGLFVCEADLSITDVNLQAVALTGYQRDELIGVSLPSLFRDPITVEQLLNQTLTEGPVHDRELQLLTKTAQEIEVSFNTSALKSDQRASSRAVVALRDISERKKAGKERSLLAAIVDSSGDAIYSEDLDFRILSWNPAAEKLFSYAANEVIGHSAALLVPLEYRAEMIEHARNVQRSRKPGIYESRRLRKDGTLLDVMLTQSPVLDSSGVVVALSETAHDIGARKLMETELAQARDAALGASRLKSEFLANMSHEIRTPLNSIIGLTGLLLDTQLNNDQADFARGVLESGESLLGLISDILDFSKISAGKLIFENIDLEVDEVVEDAVELVGEVARRKGLALTVAIDRDVHRLVRGDPGRLRQVLVNLLSNAVKFTEHGEIGLAVSKLSENPKETVLRFEVRDTGIGIPADKQHLLFQDFSQVDASTTRHYGGTGLGLSIARQLVEGMHGTIALSSAPGAGSTFWFTATFAKQLNLGGPAAERFASLAGATILIVDDNTSSRQILEREVSAWGMRAKTAESAQQALVMMRAAAKYEPFQVALLDVMMSEVDGIELARQIKADPALSNTAVLLISSVGTRGDFTARLAGIPIDGWLLKPAPESTLYNALIRALPPTPESTSAAPVDDGVRQAKFKLLEHLKMKVLLAEDNPLNQKVARLQLGKLGLEVDTVANGREAVEAVTREPYEMIFMDCQMPEMDGYEATREIRRREGLDHHAIIVAMTAHALPGDRETCLACGMDAYISKPVTQAALEATLVELLKDKTPAGEPCPVAPASEPADQQIAARSDSPSEVNGQAGHRGDSSQTLQVRTAADSDQPVDQVTYDRNSVEEFRKEGGDYLNQLVELFEAEVKSCLDELTKTVGRGDLTAAAAAAHRLKGTAATFGAKRMQDMAADIYHNASEGLADQSAALLEDFRRECDRVSEAIAAQVRNPLTSSSV